MKVLFNAKRMYPVYEQLVADLKAQRSELDDLDRLVLELEKNNLNQEEKQLRKLLHEFYECAWRASRALRKVDEAIAILEPKVAGREQRLLKEDANKYQELLKVLGQEKVDALLPPTHAADTVSRSGTKKTVKVEDGPPAPVVTAMATDATPSTPSISRDESGNALVLVDESDALASGDEQPA